MNILGSSLGGLVSMSLSELYDEDSMKINTKASTLCFVQMVTSKSQDLPLQVCRNEETLYIQYTFMFSEKNCLKLTGNG